MSRKGSKNQKEQSSYELRDVVLGKLRGFPPWPGMVVDPDSAPGNVLKERPSNKKTTWYCVRFFPAGDYAWLVAKDISKLQKHEIEAYIGEPYKKSGDLLTGYQIALDPTQWEEERQAAALEAEEESANAEVDELASEGGDEVRKSGKSSKKRKREAERPKVKATKGSVDSSKKKPSGAKSKKNGSKSKTVVESEDDGDHENADAEDEGARRTKKTSPPPAKKSKKNKDADEDVDPEILKDPEARKVREWRHQLQKSFLSDKNQIKDEEVPGLDTLFTTIEQYDKMNIAYLQFSKIGKVMRHITALPPEKIPRDGEFSFKARSMALVERWHQILSANKLNGSATENQANATATKEDAEEGHQQVNGDADVTADLSMQVDQHDAEATPEKEPAEAPPVPQPLEAEAA